MLVLLLYFLTKLSPFFDSKTKCLWFFTCKLRFSFLKRTHCAHCRAIYLFWNSTGLALHHTLLHIYLKSIFTPVLFSPFKSNSGLFFPFVGFCCSHQRFIWPISELNILWIFSVWKETKWEGKTTRLKTHHLIWARVEKLLLQTPLH